MKNSLELRVDSLRKSDVIVDKKYVSNVAAFTMECLALAIDKLTNNLRSG